MASKEKLFNLLNELKASKINKVVKQRLREFDSFKNKSNEEWFSELCFCILTANSKAETALKIQIELGSENFVNYSQEKISNCIRKNKHRFHNNKSKFIVEARKYSNGIKKIVNSFENEKDAREWLVKNVKGIGYKEASHFLRNTGSKNIAILDRHILNLMAEYGFISEKPKTLNKKKYLEIEMIFEGIAEKNQMPSAELDLFMWYLKTGKVLK